MANEITKITDQNSVDHPLRDAAAQTALTGILNGQSIDSFGDVESALDDKVDWESNTRTGVHNLLENKATSKEASGTTYTVNNDKSISLSGTPSGNSSIEINSYTGAELKAMGRYLTLSGGISQKAYLILRLADWTMIIQSRANEEQTVDTSTLTDGTTYYVSGSVESGADISGKTFYPMLRLATDTDDTYAPYAKTNRELTEDVAIQESAATNIVQDAVVDTNTGNHLTKQGSVVEFVIRLTNVTAAQYETICEIPSGYRPRYNNIIRTFNSQSIQIQPNGKIVCLDSAGLSAAALVIHSCWFA